MFAFAVLLLLDSFRYFSDFQCANLAETLLRFSARALTHTRKAVAQRLPRLLELGRRSFYEALHSVPFHNQHIDFISMSQSISTYFQYEHVLSIPLHDTSWKLWLISNGFDTTCFKNCNLRHRSLPKLLNLNLRSITPWSELWVKDFLSIFISYHEL